MGKRFEGEEPSVQDMLEAFRLLGLATELGRPGAATAFAPRRADSEWLQFSVIPGTFSAEEFRDLQLWAA